MKTHLNHRIGEDRLVLDQHDDGRFGVAYLSHECFDWETGEMGYYYNNSQYFGSYHEASDIFCKRRDSANPFNEYKEPKNVQ